MLNKKKLLSLVLFALCFFFTMNSSYSEVTITKYEMDLLNRNGMSVQDAQNYVDYCYRDDLSDEQIRAKFDSIIIECLEIEKKKNENLIKKFSEEKDKKLSAVFIFSIIALFLYLTYFIISSWEFISSCSKKYFDKIKSISNRFCDKYKKNWFKYTLLLLLFLIAVSLLKIAF